MRMRTEGLPFITANDVICLTPCRSAASGAHGSPNQATRAAPLVGCSGGLDRALFDELCNDLNILLRVAQMGHVACTGACPHLGLRHRRSDPPHN
jgi:hypothetical protein